MLVGRRYMMMRYVFGRLVGGVAATLDVDFHVDRSVWEKAEH